MYVKNYKSCLAIVDINAIKGVLFMTQDVDLWSVAACVACVDVH